MRVVLALGADDLTTKQLRERMPDVAQASLYRAIGRLVDAGIIAVVDHRQRGGARERIFRMVNSPDSEHATGTAHGFVAAADTLARALSVDAAHWAASPGWRPEEAHLRREVLHLNGDEFAEFRTRLDTHFDEAANRETNDMSIAMIVTLAAIPASAEVLGAKD
ncbi:MAG: hypothetical protein CVT68_08320 [Actinobacteria bacterium HGW-Actinobacteria-8]|nr:MAG: hypothetical protein CVT68_08320 [Actinobacteria bacterium HGW-Actinobacteria-8]